MEDGATDTGFAFARAVRQFFDGPIVMADGHAVWACGSRARSVATWRTWARPSSPRTRAAPSRYKQMLVDAEFDDVMMSDAFTGLPANMLRPSIVASGLDPAALPAGLGAEAAAMLYGSGGEAPRRWKDIWSAGHSVSVVRAVVSAVGSPGTELEFAL